MPGARAERWAAATNSVKTMVEPQRVDAWFTRAGPTRLMYYLGKCLPPPLGRLVAWCIAQRIISVKPSLYGGARANLSHVLPADTSAVELEKIVYQLILNSVVEYYRLFHNLGWNRIEPQTIRPPVVIDDGVLGHIDRAYKTGRGLLILGTHMSNFDLCGMALSHWLPVAPQVLSIADPLPGHCVINQMRERGRGELTPISPQTLRAAIRRLRGGGIVMTGVDRPLARGNHPVTFFGATAYLPTGYVRLQLMTNCLVIVLSFYYDGEVYRVLGTPPLEFLRTGNRIQDFDVNTQMVLAQVEEFIRRAPDQWMVFVPVWRAEDREP